MKLPNKNNNIIKLYTNNNNKLTKLIKERFNKKIKNKIK